MDPHSSQSDACENSFVVVAVVGKPCNGVSQRSVASAACLERSVTAVLTMTTNTNLGNEPCVLLLRLRFVVLFFFRSGTLASSSERL